MRAEEEEEEEEVIDCDFGELDELVHAYAITVHRSQGSEYPAVVIPLTTSAWMMLHRNLLYTAITRAQHLVVLVGSPKALSQALRTTSTRRRHTALTHRLHPNTWSPPRELSAGRRVAASRPSSVNDTMM